MNQNTLSEKEIMHDLLASEKQVCSAYNVGITESSCNKLRKHLTNCLEDSQQIQMEIFEAMQRRGWYETKKAQPQDVQNAKTKFAQEQQQLQ